MKLAGVGQVRKNRYTLGDRVRVKDLPWIEGPVTKKEYRPFGGGIVLDAMSDAFIGAGLDQGVGTAYDSSGEINLLSNLFYVLCYALPLLGIGIMYVTITRRMRYDQQQQVYFDENDY